MPRIDKTVYTTDEFDKVYFALQRALHPDRLPGMPDPVITKATHSVFRALRATPATYDEADAVDQVIRQ
jgi:hypothetical protein